MDGSFKIVKWSDSEESSQIFLKDAILSINQILFCIPLSMLNQSSLFGSKKSVALTKASQAHTQSSYAPLTLRDGFLLPKESVMVLRKASYLLTRFDKYQSLKKIVQLEILVKKGMIDPALLTREGLLTLLKNKAI